MTLYLFSARKLRERLAVGAVTAREQAIYLAGSFVVWLMPGYLFIIPPPSGVSPSWFYGMWFYEFAMLVLIYTAGVFYCLANCHVHPKQNFLIDFSCLNLPVSVTTLAVTWGLFHLLATAFPWWLTTLSFDSEPPTWLLWVTSTRFFDLLRFFAIVGASFAIIYRVGRHIRHIALAREAANPAPNTATRQAGSARSPSAG